MKKTLSHDDIKTALYTWFNEGEVFEIRALEAKTKSWSTRPHTVSGYFSYEHIENIPQLMENTFISYKGIYVTINPLVPDMICRSMNRFKEDKIISTKDDDVATRRWLLIDCDAKRASGIPSSNEEHQYALDKAREIKTELAKIDWPEPIEIDSGNGAQLMYRVDLPTHDDGLVKRCLEELKFASDEHVDIDQTVFNPARLWRLPGTWNCKGDECSNLEREHRQSRLLHIPEEVKCVSLSTLQAEAGQTCHAPRYRTPCI